MRSLKSLEHWIFTTRRAQMVANELAYNGGRPYIDFRLWRAPNETDTSWIGDPSRGIVGRKTRSSLVNDAGRVANKINQYIFSKAAQRNGVDDAFLHDCTGDGESITDFMQRVCASITYGRWCWVQVDRAPLRRDANGGIVEETLADKAPCKWILWDALSVPDWNVDAAGNIRWLVTLTQYYNNENPALDAKMGFIRTLWEKRDDGVYITEEADGCIVDGLRTEYRLEGMKEVPFVMVGKPSEKAWWFDDVENIQAQILNLDSLHGETLTENVYPQLVIPSSLANNLTMTLKQEGTGDRKVAALVRELTIGRKTPILESGEDKGIARYIAPSGDLKMLTEEGTRKRALLFDMAGLALFNKESRQVQTAESKQFDLLDTNSTLANRALMLQNAEKHLIALTKVFDPSFREYDPVYPMDFDVVDIAALAQALTQAANMPNQTPMVKKLIAKANIKLLRESCKGVVPEEDFDAALEEVDKTDFEEPKVPDPFQQLKRMNEEDGEEDPEDDDEDDPET